MRLHLMFIAYLFMKQKRSLIIRNFGAIISAEIELKDYNLFIGEQGSGKSTIAKLITIFENNAIELLQTDSALLMGKFEEYNIVSYFNPDSYISYHSEEGNITYQDGAFNFDAATVQSGHSLYIPAERFFISTFSRSIATLVLAKAPIPQTLLEFASLYEKAKNQSGNYQVPLFNLIFQSGEANERLVLVDHDKVIPFSSASSGIQSVVPLLMVIDYITKEHPYEHIVVEEPELNLFPQTQVDLLHYMISKCRSLTITTHSPYLLSALNNMIEASNVLKLHPEKEEEITALVPKEYLIDFDKVTAYKIENGTVVSILDEEYRMIVADQIDAISDKEGRIFSALLDLE